MSLKSTILGALLVVSVHAVAISATTTIFTDRDDWEDALNQQFMIEDFSDAILNAGVSFTSSESGHINPSLEVYQDVLTSYSQNEPTTTWTFSPQMYAFGGDWALGGPGGSGNSLLVEIEDLSLSVGSIPNSYNDDFWGFISDTPFSSVKLIGSTGRHQQNYRLDDMVYSDVHIPVCRPGDTDGDGDIDTADLTTAITNFTGVFGSGMTCADGDTNGDGDVDTCDLTYSIIHFTGAQAANAGVPDLVYDPATGNVTIDADGADMISFSLQPGPFNAADFSDLPAGLTDNIATQVGWTSFNLFSGLTGTADLGAILPAGLDLAGLQAALTTASYGLALSGGGGGGTFDIIIPEPASIALLLIAAAAIGRRRGRTA